MDIESELSHDFESLNSQEKIEELEELKERFGDSESDRIKKRMVEELIQNYRD